MHPLLLVGLVSLVVVSQAPAVMLRGIVTAADSGQPLPARIYIQAPNGDWLHPRSESAVGSAVPYRVRRGPHSFEHHTTLSAHPFLIELAPGRHVITVVHGKEYRELRQEIMVAKQDIELTLPLARWINMADRGWYSGDTHVHRKLTDLPNIMLAEDVNVAFPLTYWVTQAFQPPTRGDKNTPDAGPDLVRVDDTHVIWPRNTEYEIFTVNGRRHTLGAVFVLNHRRVLDFGVPPVKPLVDARAAEDAALLELDKHNWPWSMALVPLVKVDLFELSNNHLWRTRFAFTNWAEPAGEYMRTGYDGKNGDEDGWREFGFQNYYALLNCGFPMTPTAGTASGVHPVPLGFGRVYVHLTGGFDYEQWRLGLKRGRSFVTTGPMLFARLNGELPGHQWEAAGFGKPLPARFTGEVLSAHPLTRIEILYNGRMVRTVVPENRPTAGNGLRSPINHATSVTESGWFVVRAYERRPDGRIRFAHSAPWHFTIPGSPLRPRQEETDYLIRRVAEQIERSRGTLPPAAIAEYEKSLSFYRELAQNAR